MKYLCLFYDDESKRGTIPKEQMDTMMSEYYTFTESIKKSGQYIGGEALQPTQNAASSNAVWRNLGGPWRFAKLDSDQWPKGAASFTIQSFMFRPQTGCCDRNGNSNRNCVSSPHPPRGMRSQPADIFVIPLG